MIGSMLVFGVVTCSCLFAHSFSQLLPFCMRWHSTHGAFVPQEEHRRQPLAPPRRQPLGLHPQQPLVSLFPFISDSLPMKLSLIHASPLCHRLVLRSVHCTHTVTCLQEALELQHPKVLPLVRQHHPHQPLERPQAAQASPLGVPQRQALAALAQGQLPPLARAQLLPLVQAPHQPPAQALVQPQLQLLAQCQRLPLEELHRHLEAGPPLHLSLPRLLACLRLEDSQAQSLERNQPQPLERNQPQPLERNQPQPLERNQPQPLERNQPQHSAVRIPYLGC